MTVTYNMLFVQIMSRKLHVFVCDSENDMFVLLESLVVTVHNNVFGVVLVVSSAGVLTIRIAWKGKGLMLDLVWPKYIVHGHVAQEPFAA